MIRQHKSKSCETRDKTRQGKARDCEIQDKTKIIDKTEDKKLGNTNIESPKDWSR